jgi:hypothetical protein
VSGLILRASPSDLVHLGRVTQPPQHLFLGWGDSELAVTDDTHYIPNRDGGPSLAFNTGTDANGDRAAIIVIDRPEDYRFRRPKETVEEHHLQRFATDWQQGRGDRFFDIYTRGGDPPDFAIEASGERRGLDITQLLLQDQVARQAAFRQIKSALTLEGPRQFRHLLGLIAYVGLTPDAQRDVVGVAEACIAALKTLEPKWRRDPSDPESGWSGTSFVEGTITTGRVVHPPRGSFYGLMGFDLALTAPRLVTRDEAWDVLQRLVTKHDVPGVDELLIPITAPVADGHVYFSDAVLARFAFEKARDDASVLQANYVQRVFLHGWIDRSIMAFRPGVEYWETIVSGEDPFTEQEKHGLTIFDPDLVRGTFQGGRGSAR